MDWACTLDVKTENRIMSEKIAFLYMELEDQIVKNPDDECHHRRKDDRKKEVRSDIEGHDVKN